MIKLNCLCKNWKTHRCMQKIVIFHESPKENNNYEVHFFDEEGKEAVLNTGKESLLKFAKEIIKLFYGKEFRVSVSRGA